MSIKQGLYLPEKLWAALLSAVFILSAALFVQPAHAASSLIVNNAEKQATDNNPVWAQGGWMMKEGDTFYWYGLDISQPSKLPDGTPNPNWTKKVSAYTSTDLVTWTAHREVVNFPSINEYRDNTGDTSIPEFDRSQWFGRPLVQFNSIIDKYVMYMEYGCCGYRNSVSIWYSDSPTGPFTYQKVMVTPGNYYGQGDLGSIFTDDDGSTYLSYTVDWRLKTDGKPDYNSGIAIGKLETALNANNEYEINVVSTTLLQSTAPYKEATTLFKKDATYYLMASETNGYESSRSYYYTAPSITGPWTQAYWASTTSWNGASYAGTSPAASNSFDTQIDQILPIQGSEGTLYMYIGDRWNNMKNKANTGPASTGPGRNPFYPLTFDSAGKPIINGYEQWNADVAAGTWSPPASAVPGPVDANLTYAIVNGNSGKALGITSNLTTSGATLEQRPFSGAVSQSWKFAPAGSGYYFIQNTNSGMYMDMKDASTADGGQAIQWTANGANNQQWQLVDVGGGYYKIKNRNSGKVLGISSGSTGDGAPVIQWAETGSANQTWRFDAVASIDLTKTYSISNRNSTKSLGTVGDAAADGTKIEQRPFTGVASQSWQFEYTNGYYKIKNANSGKYMDIAGASTADGANNVIQSASSSSSQLWQLIDAGSGYYKLKNVNSGKMLGLSAGSTADGAINMQWTESGSMNQNWSFTVL
ncbi:RICIN domain-containing protein [Paenibacillus glycanilyticus]|uniref:RICIN domain-containing protein n=1 Tax=Paenibacillus glycanilyticus TaxID=126569 RepID=UPI00203E9A8D|nr:RICIN domain-containing protein [Paenibacillus glycanilyticus]MCM3629474.1 RICIN domain-containing protein [Paenibacillus glycanilyticus]